MNAEISKHISRAIISETALFILKLDVNNAPKIGSDLKISRRHIAKFSAFIEAGLRSNPSEKIFPVMGRNRPGCGFP